jgi:hypothetical protein
MCIKLSYVNFALKTAHVLCRAPLEPALILKARNLNNVILIYFTAYQDKIV